MTRNGKWLGRDQYADERVTPERAQVLDEEALEAVERGEYAEARDLYGHCSRIYRKLKKRQQEAEALLKMAECSEGLDDHKESRTQYEEAIAIYRDTHDAVGLSKSLLALGADALDRENYTYAAKLLRESAEICEKEGFREGFAVCLYLLATPDINAGGVKESPDLQSRADHAATFCRESLSLAEATIRLAKPVALSGDLPRGQALFENSVRQYRNAGHIAALTPVLLKIGRRSCLDGRVEMFVGLADSLQLLYAAGRNGRDHAAALREIGSHALRLGDTASAYGLFKESMNRSLGPESWRDRAASYLALGCVASHEEHDDLARSLFEKASAALKEGASGPELLERSIKLGRRVHYAEDLNAAALYFARCAVQARSLGEITFYIQAMYYRGCIAIQQGDYAAANRHLEECLIYYGEAGPVRRLGRTLTEKGGALLAVGDETRGRAYINRGLEIARAEKDEVGAIAALTALGTGVLEGSDGSFENDCLIECAALSSARGERHPHRSVMHHLADIDRRRGALTDSCRIYLTCIMIMGQEGRLLAAAAAIEGMAIVASIFGLNLQCVRLLAKACIIRRRTGSTPTERCGLEIDAATSAARRELNAGVFAAAWAEGELFGIRETVLEAWSILESRGVT